MKILSAIFSAIFLIITIFGGTPYMMIPSNTLDKLENAVSCGNFDFQYNEGKFSVAYDGVTMFSNAHSEYKIDDKSYFSYDYDSFTVAECSVNDNRGTGTEYVVTLLNSSLPTMKQHFTFYNDTDYFLIKTELVAKDGKVSSNYIAPMVVTGSGVQNGNPLWTNFLQVPFDNDGWVEFTTTNLFENGIGHEVGAFFNPESGNGFIIGSVIHDKWKSAIEYTGRMGKIQDLRVYSGANTELTRDQSPHGTVSGESISSAVFSVGFYDNWKDGMNEFARINTTFTAKRESVISTNPIGWNSWGSIQDKLSFENAIATSDYIKTNFQETWENEENVVYINLDSYWDNMTTEQLCEFVKHCEENGQVAGIYSAPFIVWWDEYGMENNYVAGTDISYNEIRLKKADGTYYGNDIDGCYPLDVTHPATYLHFKAQLEKLMSCGFKYIKLDFLVHGALEGDYYDDTIETGIEAYNYAMEKVAEIVGDDVFINLSMSPIFPYNYANGRRLACDAYYDINNTEYTLNSLTYGFWQAELYDYIDPDHIVLWGKDGKASEAEAHSRLLSGIVTGGSFLTGDNFVNPAKNEDKAFARYNELLTNEKIIEIIKNGEPFESTVTAKCEYASEVFTLEKDGKTYVAIFNYSNVPKTYSVEITANSTALNLFTGEAKAVNKNGKLKGTLKANDSVIFEVTKNA